ncbi:hypothetical protein [Galactobacter valiniphilus]|uniref:hypothetical protein n=1 Tax=Galactobacter valiniphilus TaxID=2676122 RepID=UPI00373660AD
MNNAQQPTPPVIGPGWAAPVSEPEPPAAKPVKGWVAVVVSVLLGALMGVVAVLWQGWSTVLTSPAVIVLPWGALLGVLAVFFTAVAWGLRAARRWVPGVIGLVAFAVLALVSLDQHNLLIAPMDARYFQVAPGAVWSAFVVTGGVVVATLAALLIVARHVPAPRAQR